MKTLVRRHLKRGKNIFLCLNQTYVYIKARAKDCLAVERTDQKGCIYC